MAGSVVALVAQLVEGSVVDSEAQWVLESAVALEEQLLEVSIVDSVALSVVALVAQWALVLVEVLEV